VVQCSENKKDKFFLSRESSVYVKVRGMLFTYLNRAIFSFEHSEDDSVQYLRFTQGDG
jgi:hypothetical protein